jgi:hypothetical protein
MKKYERRSNCNTGPALKVNSDGKSICYERLRTHNFEITGRKTVMGFRLVQFVFFNWTILDCLKPVLDTILDIVLDSLMLFKSSNIYQLKLKVQF